MCDFFIYLFFFNCDSLTDLKTIHNFRLNEITGVKSLIYSMADWALSGMYFHIQLHYAILYYIVFYLRYLYDTLCFLDIRHNSIDTATIWSKRVLGDLLLVRSSGRAELGASENLTRTFKVCVQNCVAWSSSWKWKFWKFWMSDGSSGFLEVLKIYMGKSSVLHNRNQAQGQKGRQSSEVKCGVNTFAPWLKVPPWESRRRKTSPIGCAKKKKK